MVVPIRSVLIPTGHGDRMSEVGGLLCRNYGGVDVYFGSREAVRTPFNTEEVMQMRQSAGSGTNQARETGAGKRLGPRSETH